MRIIVQQSLEIVWRTTTTTEQTVREHHLSRRARIRLQHALNGNPAQSPLRDVRRWKEQGLDIEQIRQLLRYNGFSKSLISRLVGQVRRDTAPHD